MLMSSPLYNSCTTEENWLELAIPKLENGKFDSCHMYAIDDYGALLQEGPQAAAAARREAARSAIVPCRYGWEFDLDEVPYLSIAAEYEWVCEDNVLPTVAQALFFCGSMVGGLVFGWIADRYGRVPALVGTNMIGFVAGLATYFVTNFWQFCVCRFVLGLAFDNCFTMMYILVLEYVGLKWRTFVANMWLVSQGRVDEAITIMKKFEKVNGKKVDPAVYEEFKDCVKKLQMEDELQDKTYSVLDLFRTPRLRRFTLLMIIIWGCISISFDGHVRNVTALGLDVFLTFTVACAAELPADTLLTLTLDRWGRRWLAFGTLAASGIFSILAGVVPLGIPSASLAIVGRFSINITYNIGLQYAAELLPTA
ncbi:Organic cation transporter protein [Gryllus bimaculatus]|nr:Organic cation transporter protein [Gryllus bimaculatus]